MSLPIKLSWSNLSLVPDSVTVYLQSTSFDIDHLPVGIETSDPFINTVVNTELYGLIAAHYGGQTVYGNFFLIKESDITPALVIPGAKTIEDAGGTVLFYFNGVMLSDTSTMNTLPVAYFDVSQYTGRNIVAGGASLDVITLSSKKYLLANGVSYFVSGLPKLTDQMTIICQLRIPLTATGSGYTSSEAIISSWSSGVNHDVSLGFGTSGLCIYWENNSVASIGYQDTNLLTQNAGALDVVYVSIGIGGNNMLLGDLLLNQERIIACSNGSDLKYMEGILGSYPTRSVTAGKNSSAMAIHSLLVFSGSLSQAQVKAIAIELNTL